MTNLKRTVGLCPFIGSWNSFYRSLLERQWIGSSSKTHFERMPTEKVVQW